MEFQVLPAQPSHPAGQQVTERTARHLPRLRMLALGIALPAGAWRWLCWPVTSVLCSEQATQQVVYIGSRYR